MCGHWRSQVKYVFRYSEMILGNGMSFCKELNGSTEGKRVGCSI